MKKTQFVNLNNLKMNLKIVKTVNKLYKTILTNKTVLILKIKHKN